MSASLPGRAPGTSITRRRKPTDALGVGAGKNVAQPPAPGAPPPLMVLQSRVDTLHLRYRGELAPTVRTMLCTEVAALKDDGRSSAAIHVGAHEMALDASSREGWWRLERADVDLVIIEGKNLDGWILTVEVRALTLAAIGPSACVAFADELAAEFLHLIDGQRVVRLDVCADIVGFDVDSIDSRQWITSGRAKVQRRAPNEAECKREWFQGGERVAFYVGKVPILLRVYDKTTELQTDVLGEKRAAEHARWKAAGWDGAAPVTRVEFQLRKEALKSLDEGRLRDPSRFVSRLGAAWKYLTSIWVRLCILDEAERRARWKADPRWRLVQSVTFGDDSGEVAQRLRVRGAPSAEYLAGIALSHAGKTGMLDGIELPAAGEIAGWSTATARAFVRTKLAALLEAVGDGLASAILGRRGARGAALFVAERLRAARARTSSIVPREESISSTFLGDAWWSPTPGGVEARGAEELVGRHSESDGEACDDGDAQIGGGSLDSLEVAEIEVSELGESLLGEVGVAAEASNVRRNAL